MMYQCSDRVNNFVRISCDIKIVAIVRTPLVLETLSILKVNRLPSRKCAPYTFPDRRHSSPKIRRKEQEVKTMVVIWEICIVDIPYIANIAKTKLSTGYNVSTVLCLSSHSCFCAEISRLKAFQCLIRRATLYCYDENE